MTDTKIWTLVDWIDEHWTRRVSVLLALAITGVVAVILAAG